MVFTRPAFKSWAGGLPPNISALVYHKYQILVDRLHLRGMGRL